MSRRHVVSESELREWLRRNLRARRAELNMTALAASKRVKMSLSHWQRIEGGRCNPTLGTLAKMSTTLGVKVEDLLGKPAISTSGIRPTPGIKIKLGRGTTEEVLRERLAEKVSALRAKRELTVKAASTRAGLFGRHWQKVEAGESNATLKTLVRLALALSVEPAELIAER
jgi:transcriptional regulator with XRE-family HTH domain